MVDPRRKSSSPQQQIEPRLVREAALLLMWLVPVPVKYLEAVAEAQLDADLREAINIERLQRRRT